MNSDNITDLARRNFLFPAILKTISFSSSALIVWLFGRKLAVEEYGIYNIFQAFLVYISIFSSLGFPLTLYRFFPEFHEKKAFKLMKNIFIKAIVLRGIYAFLIIQIIILFYDKISPLFHITGYRNIFIIWGIGMLLSIELEHYLLTYSSLFLHRTYTTIYGIYSLIRLILISYALFTNPSLKWVVNAEVFSLILQFFLLTSVLVKKFPQKSEEKETTEYTFKRLSRYAIYSYFQDIADVFFYINTDFFIISYFLGNIWTGIYAMGANLALMISRWYPVELFIDIIRPVFFKTYARYKSDDVLSEMFSFMVKCNLIVGLPVFLYLLILGEKFLLIFFPKYTGAYIVLFVAGFFVMIRGPRTSLEMCVYAQEKLSLTLQSKIFSLYNLFADVVFVTQF
ncbi:MAG: oligosaccharide flippase family protein, partial [bacterium]